MVYDSCYLTAGGAENLFLSRELVDNTAILHWDLSLFWLVFFLAFFQFLPFERKERKVGRRGRPGFRKEKKKKETGVQVAVAERKKGENPVLSVSFINGVRYWIVKSM